jgi:hypothetical protein
MKNAILVLSCSGVLLAACGAPSPAPDTERRDTAGESPAAAQAPAQVPSIAVETALIESGTLTLEGASTLIDGALLSYVVKHEGFDSGDFDGFAEGVMEVRGGRFRHDVSVKGWPKGGVAIRIFFQATPGSDARQPDTVIERYGSHGERLDGPQAIPFGDGKRLEVSAAAPIS